MNIFRSCIPALVLTAGLFAAGPVSAATGMNEQTMVMPMPMPGQLVCAAAKDAAWLAQAKAAYPLDTCPVSGSKLDREMGASPDFIYRETGKPDRLVRFCCPGCESDFNKDPEKYLKIIDDAAAKARAGKS